MATSTAEVDPYESAPESDPYKAAPESDPYSLAPDAKEMEVRRRNLADSSLPRMEDPSMPRAIPREEEQRASDLESIWFRIRNSALGQKLLGRNAEADAAVLEQAGISPADKIPNRLEQGGLIPAAIAPFAGTIPRAGQATTIPGKIAAGTANAIAGLAEGVASPLTAAAALPGTAGRIAAGGFAADMLGHVPGQVEQVQRSVEEGDLQGAVEGSIGAAASLGLGGLSAVHAAAGTAVAGIRKTAGEKAPEVGPEKVAPTVEAPVSELSATAGGEGVKPVQPAGGIPKEDIPPVLPTPEQVAPESGQTTPKDVQTPPEPRQTAPDLRKTAIKDAVVEQERAERGEEPLLSPERISNDETLARSLAAEEADPSIAGRLTRIAITGERPLFDWEQGVLLRERVRLNNELSKAVEDVELAKSIGDEKMESEATEKADFWSDALSENDQALGHGGAGTLLGRALAFRRLVMNDDFSIAHLETKFRQAHDYRRPTPEERSELAEIANDYKAAEEKVEAATTKAAEAPVSKAESIALALEEAADAAWERIKTKLSQAGAIPDPTILADLAIIGASKIARGAVEFSKWSKAMAEHVGDWMTKEDFRAVYDASKKHFEESKKEGKRLASLKSRIARKKAELERQLESGDFSKKPKRTPVKPDKEALDAMFELEKVKQRWAEKQVEWELAKRSTARKIFDTFRNTTNSARDVMTSFDLSATLRQGGFITFAHPIRGLNALASSLKSMKSERAQFEIENEIRNRPNYPLYKASKLFLTEHGAKPTAMEEAIRSTWSKKIPGVGASQRAYSTFLNKLRADSFDVMERTLSRNGKATKEEAVAIANFINKATGRGDLGFKETGSEVLSDIFFAPRYVASRFQLLAGHPFYRGSARTRALIAKEYVRYLIGVGTAIGLMGFAGASIGTDPRSSEFLKAKFGKTRIDILSGLQQASVLLSRLATGKTVKRNGQVVTIRGKVPYGAPSTANTIGRFVQSKLAPISGSGLEMLTGLDYKGDPITPGESLVKLAIPISTGDLKKQFENEDISVATASSLLSLLGANVQNYDTNKPKQK